MDEKALQAQWDLIQNQYKQTGDLNVLLQGFATNPDLAKWAAKQQEAVERGEKATKIATGIDLLKNLGFTVAALNQIAVGRKSAAELVKPALPSVPRRDPFLQEALYRSQRGTIDPSQTLAPAQQGIQDAYQNALVQSQIASGGQAGAYQSMAQAANAARMRAALGLAPIAQQTQLQNQEIYNQLLGQRMAETQNMFQNQLGVSQTALDQYNLEAQAAGAAQSSGRQNLYDALGRTADTLSSNPYYLPFDDGIKNYIKRERDKNAYFTSQAINNPYQNYGGSYQPSYNINPVGPYTAPARAVTPYFNQGYA